MLKLFCLSLLVGGLSAAHNVVKKSGNVGAAGAPPYPLWHLEPLYVKKLPAKSEEKREAASPVSRSASWTPLLAPSAPQGCLPNAKRLLCCDQGPCHDLCPCPRPA